MGGNNIPRLSSARDVERFCNKNGNSGKVNFSNKSKHIWAEGINQQTGQKSGMAIPENIKGNGTWHTIVKWLVSVGIVFVLLYVFWYFSPLISSL